MARRASGIDSEDIKAAIRKRGVTLEQLSEEWGYTKKAISIALGRPWPAVQDKIAAYLNIPAPQIWPERYYPNGSPKPRSKVKRRARACSMRVERAA